MKLQNHSLWQFFGQTLPENLNSVVNEIVTVESWFLSLQNAVLIIFTTFPFIFRVGGWGG